LEEVAPGVTLPGEKLHAVCAGSPLHASVTAELKLPPIAETLKLNVAGEPALTVLLDEELDRLKSAPVPVSVALCGEPVALSLMVSVPWRAPEAVGVNITLMTQLEFEASSAPQRLVWLKSPVV